MVIIMGLVFTATTLCRGAGHDTVTFTVTTYDGLSLPAQVIKSREEKRKMLLFINGSTPYDEKGHIGAFWTDEGKIVAEKHDFYLRFLDIMSAKGYSVATMAKRSFVYPTRLPRPSLTDLALDIKYFIDELKRAGLLTDEKDLVIAGYSEGSIVATRLLGMLKQQPCACILLGSATLAMDCSNQSIDDFFMTGVLRRVKHWDDERIKTEFHQLCLIQEALLQMTEKEFEKEYKHSNPCGFGFAPWESFYIDRELPFYDPVPHLLYAHIPVLICVGENDLSMPVEAAGKVYGQLIRRGLPVTFRTIDEEVHQYKKYDVFPIMDTWLTSAFQSTSFTLDNTDSLLIEKYATINELKEKLSALPYEGGRPDEIIECYRTASEINLPDAQTWFSLGIRLFADSFHKEAFEAFSRAADSTFILSFASLTWMGHLKDLRKERKEAVALYRKALQAWPGFPVRHDHWNMLIDRAWIEERMKVPFKGIRQERKRPAGKYSPGRTDCR
ncbi:MAG: hypothetical protein ACP5D1_07875 [Bacteroidales bacterium]